MNIELMARIEVSKLKPTPEEFTMLRSKVGWGETDLQLASLAIEHSLFHVTARENSKLIGMGRVVGDGALFFYIQDLVVDPDYQRKGIGDLLMEQIEQYLSENTAKGATVGLFAAQGKEAFYSRYGYVERTGDPLGLAMCKFI